VMRDPDEAERIACCVLRDLGLVGVSFLVGGGQARREAAGGTIALVEAGPILRMVLDFEFRIRVLSVGVKTFLVTVGYCELP
jgi:hypothetical protein